MTRTYSARVQHWRDGLHCASGTTNAERALLRCLQAPRRFGRPREAEGCISRQTQEA